MLIHHNGLRANAALPDHTTEEAWRIYEQHGWVKGLHKETDKDDPSDVPAVKPK